MAFEIPPKPSSSSTNSLSNDDNSPSVTSYLYLRPSAAAAGGGSAAQPSLDKEMVLRRIRRCKRVKRLQGVIDSFLRAPSEDEKKDRRNAGDGWLDDAFSSP